ncbi:MAG: hypothetical protein V9G20_30330 [Candidatus Promineifilaceae bacterium]
MNTNLDTGIASASALAPKARTVLFITGAWMHTSSWDKFRSAFEAGRLRRPSLPPGPISMAPTAAELRANPDKRLGRLTFGKIVDHYAEDHRRP